MAVTATPPKTAAMIEMAEAQELCGIGYQKLRELAIEKEEFTVSRDGVGRGFKIKLRRDECEVYGGHNEKFPEGGVKSLRRFRVQKGRA